MKKILLAMSLGLALSGCAKISGTWTADTMFKGPSSNNIRVMSGNQLYTVPSKDLCAAYYNIHSPNVKGEMQRRGLVTDSDTWQKINQGQVWKGMTTCEFFAAKGKPNTATTGQEMMELNYASGTYLFTNGKLTSYH